MPLASTTDHRFSGSAPTGSGCRIARWVLCLVACCLAFQGWTLSVERASGRAHHHVDAPRVAANPSSHAHDLPHPADLDGHRYAPEIAFDDPQPPDHPAHDHDDGHSGVAHHDHDSATEGVVYVAEDDGASTLNPQPTLTRGIHDLAVVMNPFGVPSDGETTADWDNAASPAFASHVSGPPERPPRA